MRPAVGVVRAINELGFRINAELDGTIRCESPRLTVGTKGSTVRDLEFMWKDRSSANGDCPALYKTDGGYIVQGKTLDAETLAQVTALGRANDAGLASGEGALFLPSNVLDRLRETA